MRYSYTPPEPLDEIPIGRAVSWILLSTLLISGTAFMGWLYFLQIREKRFHDDQYRIVALVQNSAQSDRLKSAYLAEWLHLSLDRPVSLYQFNAKEAAQRLQQHPVIKNAVVKKIPPGALLIDYHLRTPVAHVGDLVNAAVDQEGHLFPFSPFFTPKHLPVFYLGLDLSDCQWGGALEHSAKLPLAFQVLERCKPMQRDRLWIKSVDTSQAAADSCGQRQIVVVVQPDHPKVLMYLRLSVEHYAQGLANFRVWYQALSVKPERALVMDLRVPHLAFLSYVD